LGLVKRLLQAGDLYRVVATCRNPDTASGLSGLQSTYSDRLIVLPLDVTSAKSHQELKASLHLKGINAIDILVANAGIASYEDTSALTTTPDQVNEVFKTNVIGAMLTFQTFTDLTTTSATRLFVVISSILGSITYTVGNSGFPSSYRMSKAAINSFAACFSAESVVKAAQSKVLCVHPGWVQTDMGGAGAPLTTEQSVEGLAALLSTVAAYQTKSLAAAATSASSNLVQPDAYQAVLDKISTQDCVFVGYNGDIIPW